jgi:hypothetical protein
MGKTIVIFQNTDSTPILDSVAVTATQDFSPFTVYPGTIIGSGNNNGSRVFSDCVDGDYIIKFDGNAQDELNPLFIAGPGGGVDTTVAQTSITDYHLADDAVTTVKIIDSGVTTDKIANNAIVAAKIAAGAVDGSSLADESVIKSKLGTSVFNATMEDATGWGVNYDNVTIKYTSGGIYIAALGVDTAQLAASAVETAKIADRAVTAIKIGTGSVGQVELSPAAVASSHVVDGAIGQNQLATDAVIKSKIYAGAVGTTELEDNAITSAKIADQNVTAAKLVDSSIPIEKLDTALANSMLRFPSKFAYVSPEYSDNVSPYFDNIDDAYSDVGSVQGTIMLYPGTYTTQITMTESVNIIGVDRLRCIIEIDPIAATPYGLKLSATSKSVLFKNFTLKVEPTTNLGTDVYGIWLDSPGSSWIQIEDMQLIVQPAWKSTGSPDAGMGLYVNGANFVIRNCLVQAYGGNYGYGWDAGSVNGVYLAGTTVGTIYNSQFAVRNRADSGDYTRCIYWTDTNQDVITDGCRIEIEDTGIGSVYSFAAGSAITALVQGSLYSTVGDSNVTVTSVNSTQSSNVKVREAE